MGLVQLGFYISDLASFSTVRLMRGKVWCVTLVTRYEVKTSWGSSLGGHYFTGEAEDIEVAAAKASIKVEEYIEAELGRPRPSVGRLAPPIDTDSLLSHVGKALRKR